MFQRGDSSSHAIQGSLKGPPAAGSWGKAHGSSRNLAENGLIPSFSGCFLKSLGMKGPVLSSEETQSGV